MATNNAVNNGLSGATGTGSFVGSTSPSITTPRAITSIDDTNGNELIKVTATGSAINEITVANAAIGNSPTISATGDDTNITLTLTAKGTGGIAVDGTGTNDDAAAGYVGEFVSSQVVQASAVSLTNGVTANVTSISLTAGDWDVYGHVVFLPANTTVCSSMFGGISTTSATIPVTNLRGAMTANSFTGNGGSTPSVTPSFTRITINSTTTVYLVALSEFTTSTNVAFGGIYARRAR